MGGACGNKGRWGNARAGCGSPTPRRAPGTSAHPGPTRTAGRQVHPGSAQRDRGHTKPGTQVYGIGSLQFSSVVSDFKAPKDCSSARPPSVNHQLPDLAQSHVH